jgi:multidrug efflux pump subunit AcrA (membrane-fusion protein)
VTEEPQKRSTRLLWAPTLLAAILLALLVVFVSRRDGGVPVQVATTSRSDLLVPVLCDGTLEPAPGGELRAPESATVAEIFVREGSLVEKGSPLLSLDDPLLAEKALEARGELRRLEAERAQAVTDVAREKSEAEHLKTMADASARLLKEGATTRTAADGDALAARQAAERTLAAEARLASLNRSPSGTAPTRLDAAEALARDLESRLAAMTIRAPFAGVVYGLPRKTREAVTAGQFVAGVADPAHRRVRARVEQPDLPRIRPGQRLLVTFDGLPEHRWEGEVGSVSPGLREINGREVGEVLGEIPDPSGALPFNASVNVQIVTGEKKGVLVVPRAALYREGDKRYVWLLDGRRARRRDVSVGLVGLTAVEITAGLQEGDTVLLPGTVTLSDGLRVAASRT